VSGVAPSPPIHEVASAARLGAADFYRTAYLDDAA
jgi:hypothetical protein